MIAVIPDEPVPAEHTRESLWRRVHYLQAIIDTRDADSEWRRRHKALSRRYSDQGIKLDRALLARDRAESARRKAERDLRRIERFTPPRRRWQRLRLLRLALRGGGTGNKNG